MASLKQIRTAIATTLEQNIDGLLVSRTVRGVTQVPAAVVVPTPRPLTADFTGAFQRGMDTWFLDIYVLVGIGEEEASQDELDSYLTGAGENSIRQVLYRNAAVGLTDGTDVSVTGVSDYGGAFGAADIDHVGAILKVTARTSGS